MGDWKGIRIYLKKDADLEIIKKIPIDDEDSWKPDTYLDIDNWNIKEIRLLEDISRYPEDSAEYSGTTLINPNDFTDYITEKEQIKEMKDRIKILENKIKEKDKKIESYKTIIKG